MRRRILALSLWVLLGACAGPSTRDSVTPATEALALRTGAVLAVIGIQPGQEQRRTGDSPSPRDPRVGFGLTHLLAESLFDTGQFRLVEEQEVHKRELLEDLVQTYWVEPRPAYSEQELSRVGQQLGVALLAYGSIATSGSSGQRFALGPLSRAEQTLRVRVHVCLYTVTARATLCRVGQGEARQSGTGLVYEFRDDRLDFEQNAMGRATKQAVVLAVQALTAGIRFVP